MPRQARLDAPGALHHIMVRGINKSVIFADDQLVPGHSIMPEMFLDK